ncbi:GNAT family N-acetyltransferase [Shewanella submarina]|uniref:GNAT family N-acetyltransferase n=1 Tax=Shewanella submarina TaxID=2016376 RepID=A0ABV7GDJ0_9GAMM|nr:GNAT family N-acetyltransferase [Shewanella submarina]MCL1036740.1 GNAT family N-acetyltransferase [Shewanella submarina]
MMRACPPIIVTMTDNSLSICPLTRDKLAVYRPALDALTLASDQLQHIESIPECLAEAEQDRRFVPAALLLNQQVVGFAMYGLFDEAHGPRVWFDRFMLDTSSQGKGLGKAFGQLMQAFLCEHYQTETVYLSVYRDNHAAIHLYQKLGFAFNGEQDSKGELVMVYQSEQPSLTQPLSQE